MFDYLQKFNNLPADLRDKVSSPEAVKAISALESKYHTDLASLVMKAMVKAFPIVDLPLMIASENNLSKEAAEGLAQELKDKIFQPVADYLGLSLKKPILDIDRDAEKLIKEAGIFLPSDNLLSRFKNIISTYLRSVRSRIDTKNTLAKDVKIGGLGLSEADVEKVMKICDRYSSILKPDQKGLDRLKQIISQAEGAPNIGGQPVAPYDLKKSLASRKEELATAKQVLKNNIPQEKTAEKKLIEAPDEQELLPSSSPEPSLPLPEKQDLPKLAVEKSAALPLAPAVSRVSLPPFKKTAPIEQAPVTPSLKDFNKVPDNLPIKEAEKSAEAPKVAKIVEAAKIAPVITSPAIIQAPAFVKPRPEKISAPILPVEAVKATARPINVNKTPEKVADKNPIAANQPIAARRPVAPSDARPQMHDIKPVPKVMGPIEELQYLDLLNFRRLGSTPAEATAKVFSRIKLLENDGYDKMVAGIKAWRVSPVNRFYLRLVQEAISKGSRLEDLVSSRQGAGQEYLSWEEIKEIIALNSKLVF